MVVDKKLLKINYKYRLRFFTAQRGVLSPIILVVGGVIVAAIVIFVATGALKFNAKVSTGENQYSVGDKETSSAQDSSSSETLVFSDSASGVSLNYPSGWSKKENPATGVVVAFGSPKESSSDNFVDNVNVSTYDLSSKPNITVKQLADAWVADTKSDTPSLNILGQTTATLAGQSAEQLVYTYSREGLDIKGMVAIIIVGAKAYIVTYTAEEGSYNKFVDGANTVAGSLQVK